MKKRSMWPILAILAGVGCNSPKEAPPKDLALLTVKTDEVSVSRGAYLVNTIGCADCHSPKMMSDHGFVVDPARNLSGHPSDEGVPEAFNQGIEGVLLFNMHGTAQKGPWGVSFAANITPDETGIGSWTEEQFLTAIKKGKYKGLEGSRSLLPLMPWEYYRNLTDADIKSIFAYLKTVTPVDNVVPPPIPPAGVH
ncbi:c-type cytochrome [Muriicola sp.]|uniref:c-type cytochrome n=1 Tax=Muriicola sp. TaxID=2020856 RepID=UPI0035662C06